jgi:hypothetical protein
MNLLNNSALPSRLKKDDKKNDNNGNNGRSKGGKDGGMLKSIYKTDHSKANSYMVVRLDGKVPLSDKSPHSSSSSFDRYSLKTKKRSRSKSREKSRHKSRDKNNSDNDNDDYDNDDDDDEIVSDDD